MVDLGHLDVVVVAERLGHQRERLVRDVDRHRHVRREHDRGAPAELPDVLTLRGREAGGPDHRARACRRDELQVRDRLLIEFSVPDATLAREGGARIRRERNIEAADTRRFAGVGAERGMSRGFERGRDLQIGVALQTRDDAGPHPARGAGDDDVGHGGDYFTRPYDSRIARSFWRFASPIRHIGSRNSGSSMPVIAIASLMGMGFVSRKAARASGKSL